MVTLKLGEPREHSIHFAFGEKKVTSASLPIPSGFFDGGYLNSFPVLENGKTTLYIGLGEQKELNVVKLRSAAAKAVRQMRDWKVADFSVDAALLIQADGLRALWALAEGLRLGLYTMKNYKSSVPEAYTISVTGIPDDQRAEAETLLERAGHVSNSILFARDLVNAPANHMTPIQMAEAIREFCNIPGVQVEILDEKNAAELGMGAFLAVGTSALHPPRLIVVRYMGDPASKEITAFVGKGVTCDTGGYCLKPAGSMEGIKGDMAGAAAVAGAIAALARNNVKTNAIAVIPACENRISPDSYIPGDIITSMSGKTIEIKNTDAEGRLILADAVTYAIEKEQASRIIDVATLTGAVVATLGFITAGALTNDASFWKEFEQGFAISGEQYWLLPSYPEYRKLLDSKMADLKNIGGKHSGTITAGLFIGEFAQEKPWIHLDIAGTAWVDSPEFEFQSEGATGCTVSSLYHMLSKETHESSTEE